jgi:hypothetical protein
VVVSVNEDAYLFCAYPRFFAATRISPHRVTHAVANADCLVRWHVKFILMHEYIALAHIGRIKP